jgi:hypothetical protein
VVHPAIKDQILDDLGRLSPELQRRAVELVRGLAAEAPKGASIEELMSLTGTLDRESAREMREAIEEHCERIEPDNW